MACGSWKVGRVVVRDQAHGVSAERAHHLLGDAGGCGTGQRRHEADRAGQHRRDQQAVADAEQHQRQRERRVRAGQRQVEHQRDAGQRERLAVPLHHPAGPPAPGHAATEVEARAECEEVELVRARPQRMGWARLLKRVCDIDMRRCPRCGGVQVKIIAAILERAVIGKILTHLGLEPQPPPRSKAARRGSSSPPERRGPTRAPAPWRAAAGVQPG